jgi:hypothetical protein
MDVSVQTAPAPLAQLLRNRRRRWLVALGGAVVVIALVWVARWLL